MVHANVFFLKCYICIGMDGQMDVLTDGWMSRSISLFLHLTRQMDPKGTFHG